MVTLLYFIYFIALFTLDKCGEFVNESYDSEFCLSQVRRSIFYPKQSIQSCWDCLLEIHKALFAFVFLVPIRPLRIYWQNNRFIHLSSNDNHPHRQVKEDVLGLLGIEGGIRFLGLVVGWCCFSLFCCFVGSFFSWGFDRCSMMMNCVLPWNLKHCVPEGLMVVPKCKQFGFTTNWRWNSKISFLRVTPLPSDCFLSFLLEFVLFKPALPMMNVSKKRGPAGRQVSKFRVWSF